MSKRVLLIFFALFVVVACFFSDTYGQDTEQEIKIVGRVIAYDDFINITGAPQLQHLIVKVSKLLDGREQSTFLRVVYQALHGQSGLPKEVGSSQSQWLFTLKRATDDDEVCKESVKGWIRTKPKTDQAVPDFEKLPCYLLSPEGIKRR